MLHDLKCRSLLQGADVIFINNVMFDEQDHTGMTLNSRICTTLLPLMKDGARIVSMVPFLGKSREKTGHDKEVYVP